MLMNNRRCSRTHITAECFLEAEVDISSSKLRKRQSRELRTFTSRYHGATETEKIEREEQRCELSRRLRERPRTMLLVVVRKRNVFDTIFRQGRHMVDAEISRVLSVLSLLSTTSCTHSSTLVVVAVALMRDLLNGR